MPSPRIPSEYDLRAAVDRGGGWRGAPEVAGMAGEQALDSVFKYVRASAERLAALKPPVISAELRARFGDSLDPVRCDAIAAHIHSVSLPCRPRERFSEIQPGDMASCGDLRALVVAVSPSEIELLFPDPAEGGALRTAKYKIPPGRGRVADYQWTVIPGADAFAISGQGRIVPVALEKQLRKGDVIYSPDGGRAEVLDCTGGELLRFVWDAAGRGALERRALEPLATVTGVVERFDFTPALASLLPRKNLFDAHVAGEIGALSSVSVADAARLLGRVEAALADYFAPVSDQLAATCKQLTIGYYQRAFPMRFDRRFEHVLFKLQRLHDAAQAATASFNALVKLLPADASHVVGEELILQRLSPSAAAAASADELFSFDRQRLLNGIIDAAEKVGLALQRSRPPIRGARECYERLGAQIEAFKRALDDARDSGRWAHETAEMLFEARFGVAPPASGETRCEARPTAETRRDIAKIARSYQFRPGEVEHFDRGVTITKDPEGLFDEALREGAELISYRVDGALKGFALYYPPAALSAARRSEWGVREGASTAFLRYIGVEDSERGGPAHDMLMYALLLRLKRCGAERLDLHIFNENFPSIVANFRYGAAPSGYSHSVDGGAFIGYTISLAPMRAVRNPSKLIERELRAACMKLPELMDWGELRAEWLKHVRRTQRLAEGAPLSPTKQFEHDLRREFVLRTLNLIHVASGGLKFEPIGRRAVDAFVRGDLSALSEEAFTAVMAKLRQRADSPALL